MILVICVFRNVPMELMANTILESVLKYVRFLIISLLIKLIGFALLLVLATLMLILLLENVFQLVRLSLLSIASLIHQFESASHPAPTIYTLIVSPDLAAVAAQVVNSQITQPTPAYLIAPQNQ